LIINIANWPEKRIEHWNTLQRARAIENQVFVIGVNRTGSDRNGLRYLIRTQSFDPNEDKLLMESPGGHTNIVDFNPYFLIKYRKSHFTTQDRKPVLYNKFLEEKC